MKAPRVLVAGAVLSQPMGGVRRHNQELLPRLAQLLDAAGGGLAVLEGREGAAFALEPPIERITSDVPAQPALARAVLESRALRRALREASGRGAPFDLVHTGHLPAPRDLEVPYTLTLHDLRSLELAPMARRVIAGRVVAAAVRGAAAVIAVSETVRASVCARFALPPERVAQVPNAGDHFAPLPRAAAPGAPILALGHLERRKNLSLLLRALARDPALPPLVLAGASKAGEEQRLRALARSLGVEARVSFLGPFAESELAPLYARAGCVAVPSLLEGFGIPVLEAQRARVPLAVARAGALPEIAGADVPVFDPDDAYGCALALRAALSTPRGALDEAAARAERFSWRESAKRWFEICCRVAENGAA